MSRRAGNVSDEDLFAQLAAAFPIDPVEPDASSLHRLSLAVAELHPFEATPAPKRRIALRRSRRLSFPGKFSPIVSAGTLVGALVMGTGISYAVGVPIPAAVRSVARTVGLAPPAPPSLGPVAAAQQAESTLHKALIDGDSNNSEISHDSSDLAHKLGQVEADHSPGAHRVSDNGQHLLDEACRQMGRSPGSGRDASLRGACDAAGSDGRGGSGSSPGGPPSGTPATTSSGHAGGDGVQGSGGTGAGGHADGGGDRGTDGGTSGRTEGGPDDSSTVPSSGGSGNSGDAGPSGQSSSGGGASSSGGKSSSGDQETQTTSTTPTTQPPDGGSLHGSGSSGDGSSGDGSSGDGSSGARG
jgi:hypothetical protein